MEKRTLIKLLAIVITLIFILSFSLVLLIPKSDKISALDGLALAEKRAKQWREDAVLWDCEDRLSDNRDNGTSERWDFVFISPSTIQYNVQLIWGNYWDMFETNRVIVYANRTVLNYSSYDYLPYETLNASLIENWNFDTDQAFDYLIDEVGIYSFLDNKMEEWPDSSYSFQTSIHSLNNQTQISIFLFIHYWNYSSEQFYWILDGSTGELIEANFINPY